MNQVTSNIDVLIQRLSTRIKNLNPNSPKVSQALNRIGVLLRARTILNIRSQRLIDTGALLNSITYEVISKGETSGVIVGSEAIPYAAPYEFGGIWRIPAHTRTITKVFGHPISPRVINIRAYNRNYRRRSFLRPAVQQSRATIARILSELVKA